jgi:hypothetical protein
MFRIPRNAVGELVVAGGDDAIDLQAADHTLDPIAFAIELLVVSERDLAVQSGRDNRLDGAPPSWVSAWCAPG